MYVHCATHSVFKKEGPRNCWGIAQKTLNFAFIHCTQFVVPPDSNVLLFNVPGKMEIGCLSKCNSGCKKFLVFMF
jgi:hypothetical protein